MTKVGERAGQEPDQTQVTLISAAGNRSTAKALKAMPDLQREAELEGFAKDINHAHALILDYSNSVLKAGTAAIEQAITCGRWLTTVKTAIKHGQFEDWCARNLHFKMRKAQYYMLLARTYASKDLQKLNPQSLRQALLYAGALPVDPDKKHKFKVVDQCSGLRRTVSRLMSQIRAQSHIQPEQLLRELEPLFRWRDQLLAGSLTDAPAPAIVNVRAVVSPGSEADSGSDIAKTQHNAFSPSSSGTHELPATITSVPPASSEKKECDDTTKQKAAVLAEYEQGHSLRSIAKRHHVSQSTVTLWSREAGLPARKGRASQTSPS